MISIDLSGKRALVTGVGDDGGFAWVIAKYLNAAGADIALAVQPNRKGIVNKLLARSGRETLQLPGGGDFTVEEVLPCVPQGPGFPREKVGFGFGTLDSAK